LRKFTCGWRFAAASKTGAKARQGPHHGAQKSMIVMPVATSVSKVASVVV